MPLYEFVCDTDGRVEAFAPEGARWGTCPECGGEARRVYSAPLLDRAGTFGRSMVAHAPDRRVSNLAAEQHEHWQRTRYGDLTGPVRNLNEKFKPTIFTPTGG